LKTVVTIPIPLDSDEIWDLYRPMIKRFTETWRAYPPGADCTIAAMCCKGRQTDELTDMFTGLPADFIEYRDDGCDIGSAQSLSHTLTDEFMVCMTSRCYFWKEGWLKRLVTAREAIGPDLFGCFASRESGRLHLCTRAYCMDAADFQLYPVKIVSRDQGVFFECGEGNLLEWFEARGKKGWVAGWSGVHDKSDWFKVPNRFRDGDQSDCLLHDRHTLIYELANEEEKKRLQGMANSGNHV
jgi:hypothetical protein